MNDSDFEDDQFEKEINQTRIVLGNKLKHLERPTLNSE
jgi:hypothetical protein